MKRTKIVSERQAGGNEKMDGIRWNLSRHESHKTELPDHRANYSQLLDQITRS